jgi:abortive infection bacteriophage resistance protein
MKAFTKPALSLDAQIDLLSERGLIIKDREFAKIFLKSISYYRLSGYYFTRYKEPKSNHLFYPDTTFEQILDTYIFDRKLRVLVFDQIEKIEVAFRASFALHFSNAHGPFWYLEEKYYKGNNQNLRDQFCKKLNENFVHSKEEFISKFKENYDGPLHSLAIPYCANPLPPWWMAVEILTITELSRLYSNLNRNSASLDSVNKSIQSICNDFETVDKRLGSWLKTISFIRNVCAHHSRLWNRTNPSQPSQSGAQQSWLKAPIPESEKGLLYAGLSIVKYLLDRVAGPNTFSQQLTQLFDQFPFIPKRYMGFPDKWQNEALWFQK